MTRYAHILKHVIQVSALVMAMVALTSLAAMAQDQRHVTPVKPKTNRVQPPPKGTDEKIIQQYINGDSTSAAEEARKDSLRRVYKRYPRLTDLSFGVNLAEPLFMALGQSYASADVSATLNMWNRFQPTIELGLGWANNAPEDMNFSYKGKPSPYVKLGANYNILFKNTPDYQVFLGVRLGYSTFSYDVTDINYTNSYWNENLAFDINGERSHALWGEAGLGLKVKLWDRLSMGWMLRYHGLFTHGKTEHSEPWFIPGFGPRNSSLGFSLSVHYTLPLYRESNDNNIVNTTSTEP